MEKFTEHQLHENFAKLRGVVDYYCPELQPVLATFKYGDRPLGGAPEATCESGSKFAGFLDAPAGKGMHHPYAGGLVEHLLEMIDIASSLWDGKDLVSCRFDDAVRVIVLHDLHKAYRTFRYVSLASAGAVVLGFDYAEHVSNEQLTPNQKTLWMLATAAADATASIVGNMAIMNALFSSEGGYAKDAPREQSVLAKLCYLCDELSVVQNRNEYLARPISTRARPASYFQM